MKLLRSCVIGIFLLLALILGLLIYLPDRVVKSLIINITHVVTDRQLYIGSFELERSLFPRLTLSDVKFSNAEWADHENLFSADSIDVTVELSKLITGSLVVQDLTSSGIQLHLEIGDNGISNWQLSSQPRPLPNLSGITIVNADVRKSLVTFLDKNSSMNSRLKIADVSLSNSEVDTATRILVGGKINSLPVSALMSLQADEPGSQSVLDALRLPYSIEMSVGGIAVSASGQVSDIGGVQQVESDVSMSMDSLAQLGAVVNKPLPDIGPINLDAKLVANPETITSSGLRVPDLRLAIADPLLRLDARGQFTGISVKHTGAASVSLDIPDTHQLLTLFNVKRRLPGELKISASLIGSGKEYDVELQNARYESELMQTDLRGTVKDVFAAARADLAVRLNTPDLSLITQLFGVKMPPEWGPISANATLQGENGNYALNDIDAILDGHSKARVVGSIKSLIPFDNMHLNVKAELSTLDEISTFTSNPLPDIGPISGTGVVAWQDDSLFLQDARLHHDSQYGIAVVTGNIGDLIHFDKVRLRADADLPDLSVLELFTGIEFPEMDHFVASANLISADALDISARQLTLSATRDGVIVVGNGAVESIIKNYISVDLALESSVDALSQLSKLSGVQLPELGRLQATANLTGTGGHFALEDIKASLMGRSLSGTLKSQVEDLRRLDDLTFDITLMADDVASVATLLGVNSPVSVPATLSAKMRINGDNLQIEDTDIDIDGSFVRGKFSMLNVFADHLETKLVGDLTLVDVDATALFDSAVKTQDEQTGFSEVDEQIRQVADVNRLLSDQVLPVDFMAGKDIELDVQVRNFTSNVLDVPDASFGIRILDGVLALGPLSGIVNGGQADLSVIVDTSGSPTAVEVDLALEGFDLARSMVFKDTDLLESSGNAMIKISFTGKGSTVADIMGSATGEGGIYIEDLLFKQDVLSIFSSDLIAQLVDALNPFADKSMMDTQLLCTAIMFQLQDGLLDTPFGFATEANDFSVVGDAQINFQDETLKIMFDPKPKRGLGISLNRLAGLVKLEGVFASPVLTLSEAGLLKFGASIAAAVASGGVTLLAEGLYNKNEANSDVCAQALGK